MTTTDTALTTAQRMTLRVTTRSGRTAEHPIETVNQASAWMDAYRLKHGTRASTVPKVHIVVGGEVVGHVSLNGKVWPGSEWRPGAIPVFDPAVV